MFNQWSFPGWRMTQGKSGNVRISSDDGTVKARMKVSAPLTNEEAEAIIREIKETRQ